MQQHAHETAIRVPFQLSVPVHDIVVHSGWALAWRTAIAALSQPGLILVIGEAGTGKTLFLQAFNQALRQAGWDVLLLKQGSGGDVGEPQIVLIDDAARLPGTVLDALARQPRPCVLAGPHTLQEKFSAPPAGMTVVQLSPIAPADVGQFLAVQLARSNQPADLLQPDSVAALARRSAGVPRTLQMLAGLAVFMARLEDAPQVTVAHVTEAADVQSGTNLWDDDLPGDDLPDDHQPDAEQADAPPSRPEPPAAAARPAVPDPVRPAARPTWLRGRIATVAAVLACCAAAGVAAMALLGQTAVAPAPRPVLAEAVQVPVPPQVIEPPVSAAPVPVIAEADRAVSPAAPEYDVIPVPPQPDSPARPGLVVRAPDQAVADQAIEVPAHTLPPLANKPEEPRRAVPNAPRPARSRVDRPTLVQAPQVDMRRCRDIVAMLQLGEEVEDTDRKFLSDGCKVR